MVHALEEVRRVLAPRGVMIDVRPIANRWPVEVTSGRAVRRVGRLTDLPPGPEGDEVANNAMKKAAQDGWFVRESETIYPFFYSWDTPEEMLQHIKEKWSEFARLDEDVISAVQSAWATDEAGRRVRVRVKMSLSCWRKR